HVQSVFWLNVAIGILLTGIMFVGAPVVAHIYALPPLEQLTQVLSFAFVISAPGMVPAALLQRQMEFRKLAITRITSTSISGLVAILMAFAGAGVWSLIAQSLVFYFIATFLNIYWTAWRPTFVFDFVAVKDLLNYTSNAFGWSVINYWSRSADNMLIGRFLGSAELGYYSRTYALMLLPMYQIVNVIAQVMFPALSSIQDDPTRIKTICIRAMSVFSIAISPLMFGLAVTAQPFVLTIYGPNWEPMVPLLQVLALVGLLQTFTGPIGWLYFSTGRTDLMFRWGLISSGMMIGSIVLGIASGSIIVVVWCYALANVILFYPGYAMAGRLVGLHFMELARAVVSPIVGSTLMSSVVILVEAMIPDVWPSAIRLAVPAGVGALTYFAFVMLVRPRGWLEIEPVVIDRLHRLRSRAAALF
ncbi:MAG: lipopolysaccharide biosynthesis protein, partial [Anaerolineae bacterium]|nr:lipopolysaccharide biosynthesis protein [Anaerolineae bacterium]